ncbi:hypothetical protein QOZ80_2BG0193310 [Eleusine coracana subsp. coracana]|nr:hypothetical protein QOZ80_2BG0193310 [Eleusine coracana subsp. coracana]
MGAHAPGTERLLGSHDDDADDIGLFWKILPGVLGALLALVIMVPLLYWPYQWSLDDNKHPEYSVAIAGFSGLDPDRDLLAPTLDPTFDLTLRIVEPRKYSTACVARDSTATVSYRGAVLAQGPAPGFCGRNDGNATEAKGVMAWGSAVAVPQFARDRLAEELRRGEAAVDVTIASPARYCQYCFQMVIHCAPRLGSGEASPPCWVTTQYPTLPDDRTRRQEVRRMLKFVGKR